MILFRQQTEEEVEVQNNSLQRSQNNKMMKQSDNHCPYQIYPCCYQISLLNKNSTQKQTDLHFCLLTKHQLISNQAIPVPLVNNFLSLSNQKPIHSQKQAISCDLCQNSYNHDKKIEFYNCLHCKKQFCKLCNFLIHSKSKFLSHQVNKINSIQDQSFESYVSHLNFYTCPTHHKPRKYISKGRIVCETCFKDIFCKFPQQIQNIKPPLVEQNIQFSLQLFNEIYHNQANKLADLKQNLSKIYKDCLEKLGEKYQSNLNQLQKIETSLKSHFTQNIFHLTKLDTEIQYISNFPDKILNQVSKEIINTRISWIQQKVSEIQSKLQDLTAQICFDYKIGDKDKLFTFFQQFLKCISIVKIKRHEDDGIQTNRSSLRNTSISSRTMGRPSSNRLGYSKDNRCQSSFKKNENLSSSKQNFNLKQKDRNNLMKNSLKSDIRKNQDMTNSMTLMNRSSMEKSICKTSSVQNSAISSRNNSTLFKEKERKYDVKQIQKAEHQDLNLNFKKIFDSKKSPLPDSVPKEISDFSKLNSEPTSLQKADKLNFVNPSKKLILIKQNQKSTINSGSFLKVFDQKNKSTGRKNYLVGSGSQLSELDRGNQILIQSSNISRASIKKSTQLKRTNIKMEIYGSNRRSSTNKLSQFGASDQFESQSPSKLKQIPSKNQYGSVNSQKFKQNKNPENKSLDFDMFASVSCEKNQKNLISSFNLKNEDQSDTLNDFQKINSEISEFSSSLGPQSQLKFPENFQNASMTLSMHIKHNKEKQSSVNKVARKKQPSVSKMHEIKQKSTQKEFVFRDSTNTLTAGQKDRQQKKMPSINDNQNKKKPDFMDMRQRMRKPNYLSTRLSSNLNSGTFHKLGDSKK